MAKTKTAFFCKSCGFESPKWLGKCPSCGEWNQFAEQPKQEKSKSGEDSLRRVEQLYGGQIHEKAIAFTEVPEVKTRRISLQDNEMNRVLGGGIVPGSVILIAGEPGVGKSTLLLQLALRFTQGNVLYISGEESIEQIGQRASRIGGNPENAFILTSTNPEIIVEEAVRLEATVLIADSVQTLSCDWIESTPGSVAQIRESASVLIRFAKKTGVAVFLVGHITKDGSIAGPKLLEHMVDAVAVFEGDNQHIFRMLRCTKNRFGSTNELGIYQMEGSGLVPVENPSEFLVSGHSQDFSGSAVACIVEGVRPLMVEVQALVSSAVFGVPQRSSTGFDTRRLNMLLAVLEKRCGFKLGSKDVFLNIAGGLKVNDPSVDLAVVAAVLSSSEDIALAPSQCFAGEVGLSGEVRPIARIDQRIAEASRLGVKTIYVAQGKYNMKGAAIKIVPVTKVQDLLRHIFG